MVSSFSVTGYRLRQGSPLDRATLVIFMQRHYIELDAEQSLGPMAATVDRYLSRDTPLWWVEADEPDASGQSNPVGGLWLGQATDQRTGVKHPYVLLLYVAPLHRRRGVATALMQVAHQWAKDQGYGQVSLQVFSHNQAAQALYQKLGYQPEAILMKRQL
ncbi:MAG: GNAT family N-acetyltransferase [Leptolyngbya sp. LCM1.Bin17]|nr:MAG: GNAT family N-acetyltransferase [Leptolyngbya sp. LCM1.Bin17]